MNSHWALPKADYWSTPFAETLITLLDLFPGAQVMDIAAGSGIPSFYLADQVGPTGQVLGVDINERQVLRCRTLLGSRIPWLKFEVGDMRHLPPSLQPFDRITGNLSFMFFRPNRYEALENLLRFLKPGGQLVLTFPSLGTFDSIWNRVKEEMARRNLSKERQALDEYIEERPSARQAQQWLTELGMEKVEVLEQPLEIKSGAGKEFLNHPLLRGGFLDDVYECFEDQDLAEEFMHVIAEDLDSFKPLLAIRCAMSGWRPEVSPA